MTKYLIVREIKLTCDVNKRSERLNQIQQKRVVSQYVIVISQLKFNDDRLHTHIHIFIYIYICIIAVIQNKL